MSCYRLILRPKKSKKFQKNGETHSTVNGTAIPRSKVERGRGLTSSVGTSFLFHGNFLLPRLLARGRSLSLNALSRSIGLLLFIYLLHIEKSQWRALWSQGWFCGLWGGRQTAKPRMEVLKKSSNWSSSSAWLFHGRAVDNYAPIIIWLVVHSMQTGNDCNFSSHPINCFSFVQNMLLFLPW